MKLVSENINSFVRNQDPVKSLGLGYEGKIRAFFRQYDILDENYEVKENGEIIFNTHLSLFNKSVYELPDNLMIKGNFDLQYTYLKTLPNNLTVKGWIDLGDTDIRELPNNLYIGTEITVNKEQKELIYFIQRSKFRDKLDIC